MKEIIKITDRQKETFFDLSIYDILDKINIRCNKWVEGVFINIYVPEEIETSNLKSDLDYLFSEAIWLISLAESFNYKLTSKQFVEDLYNEYMEDFKNLINNSDYNKLENRLYTEEEKEANRVRSNDLAMNILKNLDFILKKKKRLIE